MNKLVITGLCATLLVACAEQAEKNQTAKAVETAVAEQKDQAVASTPLVSGIDQNNFDKSVRPQDDFYQYVNGNWLKKTIIPSDRVSVGTFNTLHEQARDDVMKIIEDLSKSPKLTQGSSEQKVADLYRSYMDEEKLEALGTQPLQKELAAIDALTDKSALIKYFAKAEVDGVASPLILWVSVDAKAATEYRAHFWQGGLSLPEKEYYFKESERNQEIRDKFVAHISNMFDLAALKDGKKSAETIMAIETKLADLHWDKLEVRDSEKTYNKFKAAELSEKVSNNIDWNSFFSAYGIDQESHIIINQPSYAKGFGEILANTSMDDWKAYLRWHLLSTRANYLTKALAEERFAFVNKTLYGQMEQKPRWKRGADTVSGLLGEIIGEVYVQRHFKPQAKSKMLELVENLRKAYGKSIDELEWMSVETKVAAKDKLAKFSPKIGYPDVWKDYSGLQVSKDDLVGNVVNANRDGHHKSVKKLGGAIDKTEWGMTPQTVNAYYQPTKNEIVFPAAILQPPFFNLDAEDAVNYGAIGAVIGHEMGHGFDDQGSRYDGDGNLRNWWSENDLSEFKKRTDQLVSQFSNYQVYEDLKVNGELTLGENIGDLAGLTIAYKAYNMSLGGKEAPVIDGLTGDQRFFMGFAQVWRGKYQEKALRNQVETDPHSPGNFRTIGTLSNMPEFYQAFGVKEGDEMYIKPEKQVKIW